MSARDERGTTVYETEHLEAHYTSRAGSGYIVTTKKCVVCGETVKGEGISRHIGMNETCRETLLKRLES